MKTMNIFIIFSIVILVLNIIDTIINIIGYEDEAKSYFVIRYIYEGFNIFYYIAYPFFGEFTGHETGPAAGMACLYFYCPMCILLAVLSGLDITSLVLLIKKSDVINDLQKITYFSHFIYIPLNFIPCILKDKFDY